MKNEFCLEAPTQRSGLTAGFKCVDAVDGEMIIDHDQTATAESYSPDTATDTKPIPGDAGRLSRR